MTTFAPIRGLILDLDGLLIDSERWNWQAHNEVLAGIAAEPLTLAEMRSLTGLSDEAEVQQICRLRPRAATETAYIDTVRQTYRQVRDRALAPMPGVRHLLAAARALQLRIALASNSQLADIDYVLHRLGIRGYFNAVASGDEVAYGKPAPDSYLLALRRLDLGPGEVMAVEDSAPGLQAACAAGLRCAVVPTELTALHDFFGAGAAFPTLHALANQLPDYAAEQRCAPSVPCGGGSMDPGWNGSVAQCPGHEPWSAKQIPACQPLVFGPGPDLMCRFTSSSSNSRHASLLASSKSRWIGSQAVRRSTCSAGERLSRAKA